MVQDTALLLALGVQKLLALRGSSAQLAAVTKSQPAPAPQVKRSAAAYCDTYHAVSWRNASVKLDSRGRLRQQNG